RRDGGWSVVQDRTDVPGGLGYALLNRSVLARSAEREVRSVRVASLAEFLVDVRRAVTSTSSATSPRVVVFTGGIDHRAYVEHSYLALRLGFNLAEGDDLVARAGKIWLRVTDGLEPVDVLYRRLEGNVADPLDPAAGGGFAGVPALAIAARQQGVALTNALGAELAEERALWPFVDGMAAHLEVGPPALPPLRARLDELAVEPCFDGDGLSEAAVVVRLHAVVGPDGVRVLPGGSGRVLKAGDRPERPTAAIAKDVWVDRRAAVPALPLRLPQVDLSASLPTRTAAALYEIARGVERAERCARAARVVLTQRDEDPGLMDAPGWTQGVVQLLVAAAASGDGEASTAVAGDVEDQLELTGASCAAQLGLALAEAQVVRGYLSVSTGRVLARLADGRETLLGGPPTPDQLDGVLADLAAMAGLWAESTMRGPAWRFGELGRRLERALGVVATVEAALPASRSDQLGGSVDPMADGVANALLEALLGLNESLVAYRRRHRSDVEAGAVAALLLTDVTNPRGLAFQLDSLRRHAIELGWDQGATLVAATEQVIDSRVDEPAKLLLAAGVSLSELDRATFGRWFAAPVHPRPSGRWT
ncbi:MAG: circularly permuted type 2 ATP-grasp protein, partial [Acidimicrobiia bacterium]|nr:circularly permuted type 2 ATP-grasp protein [Acidimicrobiia bacterium]